MVSCNIEIFDPFLRTNAKRWDVQTFAVDHRLTHENPASGPVEDVYAALKWMSANTKDLGVDPARLIICGDSAGGGITTGTALFDEGQGAQPAACKAGSSLPDAGRLYDREVGPRPGGQGVLGVGQHQQQDHLVRLPRTHIDTCGPALCRDENLRYAQALLEAEDDVERHLYPGAPHGFESSGQTRLERRRALVVFTEQFITYTQLG